MGLGRAAQTAVAAECELVIPGLPPSSPALSRGHGESPQPSPPLKTEGHTVLSSLHPALFPFCGVLVRGDTNARSHSEDSGCPCCTVRCKWGGSMGREAPPPPGCLSALDAVELAKEARGSGEVWPGAQEAAPTFRLSVSKSRQQITKCCTRLLRGCWRTGGQSSEGESMSEETASMQRTRMRAATTPSWWCVGTTGLPCLGPERTPSQVPEGPRKRSGKVYLEGKSMARLSCALCGTCGYLHMHSKH